MGSAISLSGCAVEVISQAARTLDSVHDSVELQCGRARAAVEASAAAAAAVFNASLQRQRAAALKVIDEYQDSQVGQIAELHVALQEHSSAIESLAADTNNALQVVLASNVLLFPVNFCRNVFHQADPETAIKSSLFIPALTAASFEAQACAKAAFSIHQVQLATQLSVSSPSQVPHSNPLIANHTLLCRRTTKPPSASRPARPKSPTTPSCSATLCLSGRAGWMTRAAKPTRPSSCRMQAGKVRAWGQLLVAVVSKAAMLVKRL